MAADSSSSTRELSLRGSREQPLDTKADVKHSQAGQAIVFASWDRAVKDLKEELTLTGSKRSSTRLENIPHANFTDVVQAATTAAAQTAAKRFRSTPALQRVLATVNRFAVIGDLLVQHHAEYTSLVWGAFRFLVLAAAEEGKSAAKLSASLDDVLQVLVRTEEYSKSFSYHSGYETFSIFQSLQDNITQLYKRVLSFLVRSVSFFEEGTFKRYVHAAVSPFDNTFEPLLTEIKSLESNIEKGVTALDRADEIRKDNFAWLRSTDYATDIARINSVHLDGTCKWFFEAKHFKGWDESQEGTNLLWIQGKPGCGKSTIAAQLVKRLSGQSSNIVISIFCKQKDEIKGRLEAILSGIVAQILAQAEEQTKLHSLIHSYRATSNTVHPGLTTLWAIMRSIIPMIPRLQCVIDGIDECSDSDSERADFLRNLVEVFDTKANKATCHKVVVLTRLEVTVTDSASSWSTLSIAAADTDEDIKQYVEDALNISKKLSKHPKRHEIYQYLTENASGMILWAKLMLSELEIGYRNIDRVLDRVPKGLSDVYTTVLTRLSNADTSAQWDHVLAILSIVSTAARPLSVKEFAVALAAWDLASETGVSDQLNPYSSEEILETIAMATPLVVLTPQDTIEIVHASLTRYLFNISQASERQTSNTLINVDFDEGKLHCRMAQVLCQYLSQENLIKAINKDELGSALVQLFEYSCRYLIYHTSQSVPMEEAVSSLVNHFDSQYGWMWLFGLTFLYSVAKTQLQVLQSEYRRCITISVGVDVPKEQHNLLIFLARQRYNQCLGRPSDSSWRLMWARALASFYSLEGDWNRAEQLQLGVLESREKNLDRDHRLVLAAMDELATTYASQGRLEEAEQLEQRLLDRLLRLHSPDHEQVLTAKNSLAIYKEGLYKLDEAQKLHEELLDLRSKILGEAHPSSITSANNLANLYGKQGKFEEASRLYARIEASLNKTSTGMDDPENLTLIGNLAAHYRNMADYEKAENLAQKAVELGTKILGSEHPQTLVQLVRLSRVYNDQHRHDKAEKLNRFIAYTRERALGSEHMDTLSSKQNLAVTLIEQAKFEEAEEVILKVVESRKKTLGEKHPSTLSSSTTLASVLEYQGRYKEAEELSTQILETQKGLFGEHFPETVDTMVNLASVKNKFAKYDEAVELLQSAVEFQVKNHGELHPGTILWRHNLTVYLHNAGKFDASSTLEEELLEAKIAKLGPEHPTILMAKHGLVYTYERRGDLLKAAESGSANLETCRRVLGNTHNTTLVVIRSLSGTYRTLGKLKEAQVLGEEGFHTVEKLKGPERSDTVLEMGDLAFTYRRSGKYELAQELGWRTVKAISKILGPNHLWMPIAKIRLAQALRRLSKIEESEELALQAIEIQKTVQSREILDPNDTDVQKILSVFSSIRHMQGRYKEAEEIREQVLKGKRHVFGDDHYETLLAMSKLAQTYKMDPGKIKDAEKLATDASAGQERAIGPKYPGRLFSLSVLASIYFEQGKTEDALSLQREVVEGRQEVLGEDHADTKLSLDELATYQASLDAREPKND